MTATCVRCGRPTADGYACAACAERAARLLGELADMVPAARDIATGQARHGSGGGSGKPGSSLPFDLTATAKLDAVQGELTTWCRLIASERGFDVHAELVRGRGVPEPLAEAAKWLSGQMEWARHTPWCEELLSAVDAAHRVIRSIASGPREQKYLGPCGAEVPAVAEVFDGERTWLVPEGSEPCDGDIYAPRGAEKGTCRACKATVATAEREAWLDGEVRQHAFTARDIADAHRINVKTIRTWATRGQLKSYWRTETGLVAPWEEPAEGEARERLHYVGDVLDLAAADAVRRHENQVRRDRRATGTDERMTA